MPGLQEFLPDDVRIHSLAERHAEIMRSAQGAHDFRYVECTAADDHALLPSGNIFSGLRQTIDMDDDIDHCRAEDQYLCVSHTLSSVRPHFACRRTVSGGCTVRRLQRGSAEH